MGQRKTGPILTSTRKDVLRGEYESGTRQTRKEHEDAIKENTELTLRDLQFLYEHLDQEDLEDIIGGGPEVEGGLVTYDDQHDTVQELGFFQAPEFFAEHRDSEGNVWDPEQNPDAKTPWEWYLEVLKESNKATPEMQKTLIDCVAFLCRAAEAGELNVREVIERGVERYYRGHPTKKRRLVNLRIWDEEHLGPRIKADFKGPASFDVPDAGDAIYRYLSREGLTGENED